jgi:hypothetical protein
MGQHYLAGNGADFAMVFQLENICGTDAGSTQRTVAQAAGAASHTLVVSPTAVRVGRRSVSSRLYSSVVEYSRVLVFHGGVLECSSRMKGNFQVRFLEGWPPAMGAGYSAEHKQTLLSVVNLRERKMLGAPFAVGTEADWSSLMGNKSLPA